MKQNEFVKELKKLNIEITDKQLEQLERYYNLLIEYNQKINLTAITNKEDVYLKHFYDSLTLVKTIKLENQSLCDVGSGAGFPGIVLKIVFPNLKITLIDALNKRINFLNTVIKELDLKGIGAIHARAEEYALEYRNCFDITTSRAVAHLSNLLEYAIPMTKENGYFIAMKGNIDNELKESERALKILDTKIIKSINFSLPNEGSFRTLLMFQKEKDNKNYPRKYSEIKKRRL